MERIRRRQRLFFTMEDQFMAERAPHLTTPEDRAKFADPTKAHSELYGKGFSLVASKEGKVFELKGENPKLLEEYGADRQHEFRFRPLRRDRPPAGRSRASRPWN